MEKNVENINALADFIEKADFEFDMSDAGVRLDCGSAGCIGGHAAALWEDVRCSVFGFGYTEFSWRDEALAEKLGITMQQHGAMCYLNGTTEVLYAEVTRADAVKFLRRLAESDSFVTWNKVLGK
jgi:hypothetical protein